MAPSLLLRRPPPFAYPGGNPGFDPSHPAAKGLVKNNGLSAVQQAGNYVNLLSGQAGTPSSTLLTPSVDGIIGPVATSPNFSDQINFTGNSTAAPAFYTAATVFRQKQQDGNFHVFFANNSGTLSVFGLNSGSQPFVFLGGAFAMSNLTVAANIPYFLAVSINATDVNFVARRLDTGQLFTQNVSFSGGGLVTSDGTYTVGNWLNTYPLNTIGPVMYNPAVFLSISQLQQWAQDPWAFWYPRTLDLVMMLKAGAGASPLITGWQNNAGDVYRAAPQKFGAAPAFVSTFKTAVVAGMAWQEPPDRIKLPPSVVFSDAPAFVATFRAAGIAGIAWQEPPDQINLPLRVSYSAPPAFARIPPPVINTNAGIPWFKFPDLPGITERILDSGPAEPVGPPSVPISGMAWFEPRDIDRLPKGLFLTDPVAITYIPQTVTWAFSVGDTTFLRDAPVDVPPAYGRTAFAQPVGVSGMAWFAPPDRDRPAVKINQEALPAIALTPATLPPHIAGMAWFEPRDVDRPAVKVSVPDVPPAFGRNVGAAPNTISGMAWAIIPDRDKPPARVALDLPPAMGGAIPIGFIGVAWAAPFDGYKPVVKVGLDLAPALAFSVSTQLRSLGWFQPPAEGWRVRRVAETLPAQTLYRATPPVGISGMAWFEPPDNVRLPPRVSFDYPTAFAMRVPVTGAFVQSQRVVYVIGASRLAVVASENRSADV